MLDDGGGVQQGVGHGVHRADVGDEDVLRVGGRAAELGVEVGAAVLEAAVADDLDHGLGEIVRVHRELVGIPAVLGVTAVGVDGAEEAVVDRHGELVLEGVAGEGGVVHLDVHLEVLVQAVGAEVTVSVSTSYWCLVGSIGLGSMRKVPLKPLARA